jgi:putative membrane protein insertion efficiency factor
MRKFSTILKIASRQLAFFFTLAIVLSLRSPCCGEETNDSTATQFPLFALDSTYESQKRGQSAFYDQTNPLSMFLVGLINLYQVVFSRQEGSATCQFRPSCSHYGSLAIKKYGALQGTLMTGDRLLRCNQWAHTNYRRWQDQYHLYDPIEDHDLWAPDTL